MERFLRLHKIVYACAGGLLVLRGLPQCFPSLTINSSKLSGTEAPEDLVLHVRKIARAMKLPKADSLKVFIGQSLSSYSGGCCEFPRGAFVGLPRTVLFRSNEDVKNSSLHLGNQPVDWESPEGVALLRALLPTADIINFRIAHEIVHLKKHDIWWHVLLTPVFLVSGYYCVIFLCRYFFSEMVSWAFPILMGMLIVAYTPVSTWFSRRLEVRADREAAKCCRSYTEGGIELLRSYLLIEQLTNRKYSKTWFHRLLDSLDSHPKHEERLDHLERILRLHGK